MPTVALQPAGVNLSLRHDAGIYPVPFITRGAGITREPTATGDGSRSYSPQGCGPLQAGKDAVPVITEQAKGTWQRDAARRVVARELETVLGRRLGPRAKTTVGARLLQAPTAEFS